MTTFTFGRSAALKLTALGAVAALGACESGGTLVGETPNPYTYNSTVEASQQINALDNRLDNLDPTTGSQLPPSGTAEYQGMAYMNDLDSSTNNTNDPVFYYGQMEVNASFDGNGQVTGTADNFIDGNNNFVDGSLALTADNIVRGPQAAEFTGTLTGAIQPEVGAVQSFNGLTVEGGFAGPNAEYVAGAAFDELQYTSGGEVIDTVPFTFGFIANQ